MTQKDHHHGVYRYNSRLCTKHQDSSFQHLETLNPEHTVNQLVVRCIATTMMKTME